MTLNELNTGPCKHYPQALRDRDQWMVWANKVPYQPTEDGTRQTADSTDPETWTDFSTCRVFAEQYDWVDGLAFGFRADGPFLGIDLDKCLVKTDDGTHQFKDEYDWMVELIQRADTYTELSPSGTGLHLYVYGSHDDDFVNKGESKNLETYDRDRYFTVTGDEIDELPSRVNPEPELGQEIVRRWQLKDTSPDGADDDTVVEVNDTEVEDKWNVKCVKEAIYGAEDEKGIALWEGDWDDSVVVSTGGDWSRSQADQVFANKLAFYTGEDKQLMFDCIRLSDMMRGKWQRGTYQDDTLGKAIRDNGETIDRDIGLE